MRYTLLIHLMLLLGGRAVIASETTPAEEAAHPLSSKDKKTAATVHQKLENARESLEQGAHRNALQEIEEARNDLARLPKFAPVVQQLQKEQLEAETLYHESVASAQKLKADQETFTQLIGRHAALLQMLQAGKERRAAFSPQQLSAFLKAEDRLTQLAEEYADSVAFLLEHQPDFAVSGLSAREVNNLLQYQNSYRDVMMEQSCRRHLLSIAASLDSARSQFNQTGAIRTDLLDRLYPDTTHSNECLHGQITTLCQTIELEPPVDAIEQVEQAAATFRTEIEQQARQHKWSVPADTTKAKSLRLLAREKALTLNMQLRYAGMNSTQPWELRKSESGRILSRYQTATLLLAKSDEPFLRAYDCQTVCTFNGADYEPISDIILSDQITLFKRGAPGKRKKAKEGSRLERELK